MAQKAQAKSLPIIHVCGIPASGKTTFCRWLEAEKGFKNLEFDKILQGIGSKEDIALVRGKEPQELVRGVRALRQPAVIDWGFPPNDALDLVKALLEEGVALWWFDADHRAAQEAYRRRAGAPLENFRARMAGIAMRWPELERLIGKNVVETLRADGSFLPPDVIFSRIFGRG